MDEFEANYATGEGTVHFREKPSIPRWVGGLLFAPLITMPAFIYLVSGWSWLVPGVAVGDGRFGDPGRPRRDEPHEGVRH